MTPTEGAGSPTRSPAGGLRSSLGSMYVRLFAAAALVVAVDQGTKQLALGLDPHGVDVIPGVLRLRLTYNSGGAFGILQGSPGIFMLATFVIVAAIVLGLRRVEDRRWAIPLGMILGGGLGNGLDRLLRDTGGGVVDFIDLHVWPVFNVADSAIVVGALLILLASFRQTDG